MQVALVASLLIEKRGKDLQKKVDMYIHENLFRYVHDVSDRDIYNC